MSLILEALRKSEAERRRGEAPGLQVELPPAAAIPRRRFPAWMIMAMAAAAGLLLALALLWPRLAGDADAVGPAAGTEPAPAGLPPPSRSSPAPVGALETEPGPSPPAVADFPRVERIEPAAEVPVTIPPMASAARPAAIVPPSPPAATPDSSAVPPPASVEAPMPPEAGPPATPAGGVRITGLPAGQRERLPAMKLSLHMWNEDPARRFVVIDGQRRIEGDRVGEATITAIDRDGVLLDLDGRQVRVPLP